MLNQATGTNVSNQAALMAGQRGASQNVGLIARQAGQQGAQIQQQAAGQGATLQANQSLNALNSMGSIAGQQVNQQQAALSELQKGTAQQQSTVYNAISAQNAARVNAQNNADTLNTRMNMQNAQNNGNLLNSSAASIGAADSLLQKAFDGNTAANSPSGDITPTGESTNADLTMPDTGMMTAAHGGQVNLKGGGHVPGKAAVKGDSIKNDTVPAMLSPKEIVIPRSIAMHPNAPKLRLSLFRHASEKWRG